MNIASITNFCNESFRIADWIDYYGEYKDEISLHVIVNNGSISDTEMLKSLFPRSLVLYSSNRALTASTNLALINILGNSQIDGIALISNDYKIENGGITKLYDFLYSDNQYGMVSPIAFEKDSDIIALYGANIHPKNLVFIHLDKGKYLKDIDNSIKICDGVQGGLNMAKRIFYEKVGLQDEKLFMYADEVDIGIRGKIAGFKFASTINIRSWHQHTYPNNVEIRSPLAGFLEGRNEIYLAKKHFGTTVVLRTFMHRFKIAVIGNVSALIKNKDLKVKLFYRNYFIGVMAGILGIEKISTKLVT